MIAAYVGIPYQLHGTTREGLDCWQLVRLYYLEQYGIELPSFGDRYGRALNAAERAHIAGVVRGEAETWRRVPAGQERAGDVLLFRVAGDESHLGIVVDGRRVLHARPVTGSCVERYDSPTWSRRVIGFYRYPRPLQ